MLSSKGMADPCCFNFSSPPSWFCEGCLGLNADRFDGSHRAQEQRCRGFKPTVTGCTPGHRLSSLNGAMNISRWVLVQGASLCSLRSLLAMLLFCKHLSGMGSFYFYQNHLTAGWTCMCSSRNAGAFITRKLYFDSLSFSSAFQKNPWRSWTIKMAIILKNNLSYHHFLWTCW